MSIIGLEYLPNTFPLSSLPPAVKAVLQIDDPLDRVAGEPVGQVWVDLKVEEMAVETNWWPESSRHRVANTNKTKVFRADRNFYFYF